MQPAVEPVPPPQATDEDSLDWECEPSFQMGEEPLSCSSPLPSRVASSPVLMLTSVDQLCTPGEASLSGDLPGSPPDVEGMVPMPSPAPSGQVDRNLPEDHQEETPCKSPGNSPQVTSSVVEDSFLSSQPGGDHRPHSPLLSHSLEAMAEDLQEVQGDTSEYTPLLSESLEASLPPYVPTSQGGSSTTLTPGATDSSGPDTVHHPWQPKVLPSDAERIQAWTQPPCARCTRQASWNVFRTRFTLCPTSLSGLDYCAHQVAKPILVWPPEGWALLNPKERLETHLHLVAILEAGWYPNSPDGSAIPSTVPSNSLVPPRHR